jgi:hypothetical protein
MLRNQLEIFATPTDFVSLLRAVQKVQPLKLVQAGLSETSDVRSFNTLEEVHDAVSTSDGAGPTLLAFEQGASPTVREVPQRKGGTRYAIDQLENPGSVTLHPRGAIGGSILLAGQIGTTSEDLRALKVFKAFSTAVRAQFVKVKSYWVGAEALRLLDGGMRLTATPKSPPEYDLTR